MSKTILVVEDDRSVLRFLQEFLEDEGFRVITEKDGEWALRTFKSKKVDLVLLDILIPELNGFQVVEKIRKSAKGKKIPIVMMSGIYRSINHRDEAIRRYGVVEFLDKPIRTEALLRVLQDVFETQYPSPIAAKAERQAIDQKAPEPYASPESHQEKDEVEAGSVEFRSMARQGDLAETSLGEILRELYRESSNGALLLKHDKIKKIIYFRNGYPTFIKSNLLNECLGKIMVREKMITEKECEESIQRMKESKRQQGTILIEMSCISPHNLQYALELQLQTKLFELFNWEQGEYRHNPQGSSPPTTVSLDATTAALIYEGIHKTHDLPRLKALLESDLDRFVVPHSDPLFRFQDMDLDETEEKFVARLRGDRTLREILDLGLNELTIYQIIYALKCAGVVTMEDNPKVDENEPCVPPPVKRKPQQRESDSGKDQRNHPDPQRLSHPAGVPVPNLDQRDSGQSILEQKERTERERLAQDLVTIENKDYFQILGVSKNATIADVKKAYFYQAKNYHPDRLSSQASTEVRNLAKEIFDRISKAHEVLSNHKLRDQYAQEQSSSTKCKVSSEVSAILSAEGVFQKGEAALTKRDYPQAKRYFREACKLCPEEGEFHAYLGWSTFQCDPKNDQVIQQARDHLNQAISLNPKVDRAYLFLGYLYKALNFKEMAEHEFEKAIQVNPDCTDALRELRLINLRRKGKKKGLLKR